MHQLKALCPNRDQQENKYCAVQLCGGGDGLAVQICCQLRFNCPQLQPFSFQVSCERKSATLSRTVGGQPPLGLFETPAILKLFLLEAFKSVLQP